MNQTETMMMHPLKPLKSGELLVKEGLVGPEDIEMALGVQKKRKALPGLSKQHLIGMILCDLNLITPLDNYYVLQKHNKLITIESALESGRLLSKEEISDAVKQSEQQDIPLISFLLKTGQVSPDQMQKIVFSLFHIPFRSISDFIFNEKDRITLTRVMEKDRSEKHRMIPLVVKENTILFGITTPDNLLVIREVNEQFPQYRIKCLFVPVSGYNWFSKIIYDQARPQTIKKDKPVDLSLLLSFKTIIKDPEIQKQSVWILYERYEMLRRLTGKDKRGNFQDEFNRFIQKMHNRICREYNSDQIEYSLLKEGETVSVVALPLHRAQKKDE